MADSVSSPAAWEDDVLDRKVAGDFLYQLLVQRFRAHHSQPGTGALCVAIDAEWGAGKSYFIRQWSTDVQNLQHPVVHFDAWVNDLADDPLLGFMAGLQAGLTPWIKALPLGTKVKRSATDRLKKVIQQAPKAVLPAMSVIGAGLIKKLLATDVDDIVEAVKTGSLTEEELEQVGESAKEVGKEGLQKFFDLALKAHTSKQEAIRALKDSIEELLSYLGSQEGIQLPLFICVDELDRCRPDYAIRLLEGIKHLFDAQGVCFVVSTNLSQLAESARAVYGSGFDGYRYLKRFFAFDYRLPDPNLGAFARSVIERSALARRGFRVSSGTPGDGKSSTGNDRIDGLSRDFSAVAHAFNLDLRSQQQVLLLAESAVAMLPDYVSLHSFYLFFLAAAYSRGPHEYELVSQPKGRVAELLENLKPIKFTTFYRDDEGRNQKVETSFNDIVMIYESLRDQTISDIRRLVSNSRNRYPQNLRVAVLQETDGGAAGETQLTSLSTYYEMVRAAGQVRA